MSRTLARTGLCLVLPALVLVGALAGCGKKGAPRAPEGEASKDTNPQTYPNPASVLPEQDADEREERRAPAHAGGISTFPATSRTKTTYGSGAVQ